MILRPYQQECKANIETNLASGALATLAVLPTGCGKTVIFGHVAHDWQQGRVLVMAHREELIFQARDKIAAVTGEIPDVEMGEFVAARHGLLSRSNVVVTSVQTQNAGRACPKCGGVEDASGKSVAEDEAGNAAGTAVRCNECIDGLVRRMQRFDPMEFGLLIIDEAHHAAAESYRRVIEYYRRNPDLRVLGVTATPDRQDEAALGKIFDSVAFEYGVVDAINDGWLVPIHQEWIVCKNLDFSKVRTTAGDLNNGDLEKILTEEESLHQVTSPTVEIAGDRPTLVFAASVAHAELMADIFNRHKPGSAICIHGGTPSELRRDLLSRYAAGEYQYLCGCGVFLEGFDEPRIEVIAMARPTKSRALYAQAIGRGTRPIIPPTAPTAAERKAAIAASAKPNVLVLDFVGNSGRHKLVSTADILGGNYDDEFVEKSVRKAQQRGGPVDMLELFVETKREEEERRRRERGKVVAAASYTRQQVSPFDVFDLTPAREPGWHKGRRPTEKMAALLEKAGIDTRELSFTEAKQLVGEVISRRERGLCSYKQAKLLARYGYDLNTSFEEAGRILDALKSNGWRRPDAVGIAR